MLPCHQMKETMMELLQLTLQQQEVRSVNSLCVPECCNIVEFVLSRHLHIVYVNLTTKIHCFLKKGMCISSDGCSVMVVKWKQMI